MKLENWKKKNIDANVNCSKKAKQDLRFRFGMNIYNLWYYLLDPLLKSWMFFKKVCNFCSVVGSLWPKPPSIKKNSSSFVFANLRVRIEPYMANLIWNWISKASGKMTKHSIFMNEELCYEKWSQIFYKKDEEKQKIFEVWML
jgi:hypothetical protein